ncbi:hypothetical protein D3C78_1171760 [compost metagenome]
MDNHFHHGCVQLVAVAHGRRTPFDITDVTAFVGHQNGALELSGFFGVDTEIGRQFHRATHAFRDVNKGPVRGHGGIECSKEIIVTRHNGADVLFHQIRMIVDRFAE